MRMAATFQHFLHDHPLELRAAGPPSAVTCCSACQAPLVSGRHYYSCTTCAFYLHRPCFNLPQLIRHPADPDHNLNLILLQSSYCKACREQGSGSFYNCDVCQVNYHSLCMLVPLTKQHASHPHELKLRFSSPYGKEGFICDLCDKSALEQWLYRCDDCQFDVHLSCSFIPRAQSNGTQADPADYAPSAPVGP